MEANLQARQDLYNAVCDELTNRGIGYRKPDVFGFVAGCWPTDSDAEQLAEDWIEVTEDWAAKANDAAE